MKTARFFDFVRRGMLMAAAIVVVLVAATACLWVMRVEGAPVLLFLLVGPVPLVLTAFDLTNAQIRTLAVVGVLPYWLLLGLIAGWCSWNHNRALTDRDQGSYRRSMRRIPGLVCALALLGGLVLFRLSNFTNGGPSATNAIINNLRQIEGAKQQLALERSLPEGHTVTEADLAPYLGRGTRSFPQCRPWGERYVINPIGTEPYAIVDEDHRVRRRGWTEGHTVPKGTVVRLQ